MMMKVIRDFKALLIKRILPHNVSKYGIVLFFKQTTLAFYKMPKHFNYYTKCLNLEEACNVYNVLINMSRVAHSIQVTFIHFIRKLFLDKSKSDSVRKSFQNGMC